MNDSASIHHYDQALAAADTEIDHLGQTLHIRMVEHGRSELQAVADVLALLKTWDRRALENIVAAAALRTLTLRDQS
jgi:hypothetical protein